MTDHYFNSPSGYRIQKTLRHSVSFGGVGLHTGCHTRVRVRPAEINHGIIFMRTDYPRRSRLLAHYDAVVATDLATTLGYRAEPTLRIGTVEHLLSALFALGVTNALIEVDGPELPVLDGSALPYVEAFLDVGLQPQAFSTPVLKILKPIKVYCDGAICELLPREHLRLTVSVDFPHPSIGLQTFAVELTPARFREEIAGARTFGFLRDLERLRSAELARGASLENVLAFSDEGVLNHGGMRFTDECVRHKLLDAIGDLALCGCSIEGEFLSFRGGHSIHLALFKSLRNQTSSWKLLPVEPIRPYSREAPFVPAQYSGLPS